MPLSDQEQRVFAELTAQLVDPQRRRARLALKLSVVAFVAGLALLLATLPVSVWLAGVGYLVMLDAVLVAEWALQVLAPKWWEAALRRPVVARDPTRRRR